MGGKRLETTLPALVLRWDGLFPAHWPVAINQEINNLLPPVLKHPYFLSSLQPVSVLPSLVLFAVVPSGELGPGQEPGPASISASEGGHRSPR